MLADTLKAMGLSNREREVAILISRGLTNKAAADQLFIGEKTIKFHLTQVYKKLKIKSRSQLIVWCMPFLSFEEKEIMANQPKKEPLNFTIPFGISKVGNA